MANTSRLVKQQDDDDAHQFLNYQYVDINFIYSFTWDITQITWEDLCAELKDDHQKGWTIHPLHERIIQNDDKNLKYNYQPNLVFKTQVLERSSQIFKNGELLLPLEQNCYQDPTKYKIIPIDLSYSIRLFDNGAATCTFRVCLHSDNINFHNIHAALHLTQNVDIENRTTSEVAPEAETPFTQSFLLIPELSKSEDGWDHSLFPKDSKRCSLYDLFYSLFVNPPSWAPAAANELWNEREVIDFSQPNQSSQSPFVFTIAQVERKSFLRFRKHPSLESNREIASILCKLTLDNRSIERDYSNLSENYIRYVIPYDNKRKGLINLCLDKRLFFTISRRGAIALTADLKGIPSYFVIPSLLNLCEILRARWHMGSIVSARLDQAIADMGRSVSEKNTANTLNPLQLMETMFKWRILAGAFLRDPTPFLFDGGSVSEVAEIAERLIWLDRLCEETKRKFEMLDQLVRDYLNIDRQRRLRM